MLFIERLRGIGGPCLSDLGDRLENWYCCSSSFGETSIDVLGVSRRRSVWESNIDCLDRDDASVLLLLSPCDVANAAVLGLEIPEPLSPVNSNLVNASTSRGVLLLDIGKLFEDTRPRPRPSVLVDRGTFSTAAPDDR